MRESVFEISKVTYIVSDGWLVEGRASGEIEVGDTLFISIAEPEAGEPQQSFTVAGAAINGNDVVVLERGSTGGLLVKGAQGEVLSNVEFLYK